MLLYIRLFESRNVAISFFNICVPILYCFSNNRKFTANIWNSYILILKAIKDGSPLS